MASSLPPDRPRRQVPMDTSSIPRGHSRTLDIMQWVHAACPPSLSTTHVHVLVTLARYCDEDGVASPSLRTLAAQARYAVPTISRTLRDLASLDLVEISPAPGVEGRQNRYRPTGYRTDWAPMGDADDTDPAAS